MPSNRVANLRAALAAVLVNASAPEVTLVHRWLDTWTGIGLIVVGMQCQGWDVQLTAYGDGHWRATFRVTGLAHSITGARPGTERPGTRSRARRRRR